MGIYDVDEATLRMLSRPNHARRETRPPRLPDMEPDTAALRILAAGEVTRTIGAMLVLGACVGERTYVVDQRNRRTTIESDGGLVRRAKLSEGDRPRTMGPLRWMLAMGLAVPVATLRSLPGPVLKTLDQLDVWLPRPGLRGHPRQPADVMVGSGDLLALTLVLCELRQQGVNLAGIEPEVYSYLSWRVGPRCSDWPRTESDTVIAEIRGTTSWLRLADAEGITAELIADPARFVPVNDDWAPDPPTAEQLRRQQEAAEELQRRAEQRARIEAGYAARGLTTPG